MYSKFNVNDAIDFSGNTFKLTTEFRNDILSSSNPILVSLVGPARSGKSTLANILLNPVLPKSANAKNFFLTDDGSRPVTYKVQYTKIKLASLIQNHQLSFNLQSDHDVFILDCEGIDSLGDVTQSLRKAIFTLLQISTVNIYVTKNLDRSNIYDLKAFFSLPKLIPGTQQKLRKSNSIILVGIGVPGKPSEVNFESERKKHDLENLNNFLSHLKEKHIDFNKENTAFFAQPKWEDEKHYFESIRDLIVFINTSISQQVKIPGKTLVEIFDKCIPIISQINELDDPDIRLEKIIKDLIDKYFQTAYEHSINLLPSEINSQIKNKNAKQLIELSKDYSIQSIQKNICHAFLGKANQIFENLANLFPEKYKEYNKKIQIYVQTKCTEELEKQFISKVIPYISDKLLNQSSKDIMTYYNQTDISSIRQKNKTKEITNLQKKFIEQLNKCIRSFNPSLISSIEYNTQMNNLNIHVANEVSNHYERRLADGQAMDNAQALLDEYQKEREKYEQQIYWVCEARVPVSCGGKKRWVREGMEYERDQQGRMVKDLRQQYDASLTNLDNHINKYLGSETSLSNELINKKLNLLNQELNDRKQRDSRLYSEIDRAKRPVHSGGGFWRDDRIYLESLQDEVQNDINQLQQAILNTRNMLQ